LPEKVVRELQASKLRRYLRNTVLPFSSHYRELFRENHLTADSFRTLDDLHRLPLTSKADLLNTPENPKKIREFILTPDPKQLARRPSTIVKALLHGREAVAKFVLASTRFGPEGSQTEIAAINGELAMILRAGGKAFAVVSITAGEGQVREVRAVGNPDKLNWVSVPSDRSDEVKE